jgi:hypothetical protein
MNIADFQRWLIARGAKIVADGFAGPKTRDAIMHVFQNRNAPSVTSAEICAFAQRIGITEKQMRAIASVESGGSAFDANGRPKILFERHIFHRQTQGRYGTQSFSNPASGGYSENSWAKLQAAASVNPVAAFASCSWGKFQVMGFHAAALRYNGGPLELAYSTSRSEAASYEALARFIITNGLADEARMLSTDPETCRAFARGYNGSGYARNDYHVKLARAMR